MPENSIKIVYSFKNVLLLLLLMVTFTLIGAFVILDESVPVIRICGTIFCHFIFFTLSMLHLTEYSSRVFQKRE